MHLYTQDDSSVLRDSQDLCYYVQIRCHLKIQLACYGCGGPGTNRRLR